MVAFGHYIEHLKTCKPEWAAHFLNYGNLKTIITRLREFQPIDDEETIVESEEDTPFVCYTEADLRVYKSREPHSVEEVKEKFVEALQHEVDKAGALHSHLLEHFRTSLENQVDDYWKSPSAATMPRKLPRETHDDDLIGLGPPGPMMQPSPDHPKYWHNKRMCETLYQEVSTLKHFSGTHRIAIRKIIKKFNKALKKINREDLQVDTAEYVDRYNTKAQDPHGGGYSNILLENIECTYAEFHACESIHDARKQLKRLQAGHEHSHSRTADVFLMGILVGLMLALGTLLAYLYFVTPDALSLTTFWVVLPVYRACILLIAALWAWSIDLYFFSRCYLNHTYILGLNPDWQMPWYSLMNYAAVFTLILCVNLAVHFILFDQFHPHFTIFVLLIMLLALVMPLNVMRWDTRKAFLKTLWRCIIAPFQLPYQLLVCPDSMVTVQFKEFFLADQFISASILLGDLTYSVCFGVTSAWLGTSNELGLQESLIQADNCIKWNNRYKPFVIIWPYLWRMSQCVTMLKVTQNKVHLYNLIKYSIGVLILVVGYVGTWGGSEQQDAEMLYVVWVAVTFVGQSYAWAWDVMMDWGWKLYDWSSVFNRRGRSTLSFGVTSIFFDTPTSRASPAGAAAGATSPLLSRDPSQSPFIRSTFRTRRQHLPWIIYAVSIPTDLFMRFLCFTQIDEGLHPFVKDPRLMLLMLGLNETARRCAWNVLRIENEQLHNLESYRSKTDEVPEPLNRIFGEDWVSQNAANKGVEKVRSKSNGGVASGYQTFPAYDGAL
eukprot:TRINITY_DN3065_c1_g1_i1.p1 TRINITY_DN3065_c1_g1~~TRINITY_DN3065_c1_g1_i1.p1  ORF type:complete len:776 (+),score=248.38 TRINITY_DN3065_c1_g1_i1:121-2448(+)